MALSPGTRFGPYVVAEQIGAGGMGEVYRATDSVLKRDVALKVLPESFASDADRLARFQREAEVLASFNHANIAHIYGLEKADGKIVIVMELVTGPTLAERIAQGPIPPDAAMGIARQVADALEAAHARGIVHRDLKPGNIKLNDDGTIKVLDFGISKSIDPQASSGGRGAPTVTPAMTETGVILGTAAYMSPEQARGKFVDQRTDVWAFGCLLFEMLTGQQAFAGEDVMMTLARVLDRDTDLSSMPGTVSPAVRNAIKLCLEKNPRKRIADIRDVRLALEGAFETEIRRGAETSQRVLPTVAAAVLAALLAGGAVWALKPAPPAQRALVTRFAHALPAGVGIRTPATSVLDVAPSGEFFVINTTDGIHLRSMADVEGRVIPGTVGGPVADVVVSPDGRDVAYYRNAGQGVGLARVAVSGGAPIALAENLGNPFGLSWEADGTILFGQPDGIWRVAANGGTPERIVETGDGEQVYGPQLLPGGEWVLFTLAQETGGERWNRASIVIQSLTSGERRVLRSGGFDGRYLPTGHLTYVFENVLFASAFDPATLELDDDRVSLIQGVQSATIPAGLGGSGFYAVARNGTLVYVPGVAGPAPARAERSLVWVDRRGNAEPLPIRPDNYTFARISPDGTKIALVIGSTLPPSEPPADIYLFDLETENLTQLTFDPAGDDEPVWTPDGNRIIFRSYREQGGAIFAMSANGGDAELLARSPTPNPGPWAISPDGKTLFVIVASSLADTELMTLAVGESDELKPLMDEDALIVEPSLSPNGQWLVYYRRSEPGAPPEVNVRPFPDVRQQRRPVGMGVHPVFSKDGSQILFFDSGGLSAASIDYAPFRIGNPEMLFRGQYWYGVGGPTGQFGRAWDVDPNSERFLMIAMPNNGEGGSGDQSRIEINVVLNWLDELEERVPPPQ